MGKLGEHDVIDGHPIVETQPVVVLEDVLSAEDRLPFFDVAEGSAISEQLQVIRHPQIGPHPDLFNPPALPTRPVEGHARNEDPVVDALVEEFVGVEIVLVGIAHEGHAVGEEVVPRVYSVVPVGEEELHAAPPLDPHAVSAEGRPRVLASSTNDANLTAATSRVLTRSSRACRIPQGTTGIARPVLRRPAMRSTTAPPGARMERRRRVGR